MIGRCEWSGCLGVGLLVLVGCGGGREGGGERTGMGREFPGEAPGGIESRPLVDRAGQWAGGEGERGVLFREMSAEETGMNFGIRWDGVDGKMREFLFLAAMGGIATGDYDGDGLADVFVTSPSGGSRLFHNEGGFRFRDVTEVCGLMDEALWGTGATFGDLDNDGDLDLWLCVYGGRDRVYLNEGPGNDGSGSGSESGVVGVVRFVESGDGCGVPAGRASMGVALADYDLDGDLDAYVTTTGKDPPPGTEFKVRFEEREDGVEVPYVLDELSEYWELLYLPGDRVRRIEAGQRDHLLRNDGIGSDGKMTFKDVSRDAGIGGAYFTLSARWWDYDGDCWPDLYVSNDYTGPDQLWRNLGDGTFEEVIRDVVPHTPWFSMGADAGDLNGDGLLDFVVADMAASSHYREKVTMGNMDDMGWFLDWAEPRQYMRNAVYLNSGAGRMLEAGHLTGLAATDWTWSVRMEDFDSDGRLDVFFTNGAVRDTMNSDLTRFAEAELKPGSEEWVKFWKEQPVRAEKNRVYRNRGGLAFEEVGEAWGLGWEGVSFGAATADLDGDGDEDVVVSNFGAPVGVYRNTSVEGNLVKVKLRGALSNASGIGARVRVKTRSHGEQVRELALGRGWLSSSEPVVHIGTGADEVVSEMVVEWPSGRVQRFSDLEVNRLYTVSEPAERVEARGVGDVEQGGGSWFVASDALAGAVPKENEFDDFAVQPLLPNRLSAEGPAMAWGDVDGDGDRDLYLGGAVGTGGQLWTNGASGGFSRHEVAAFEADRYAEDGGAVFFDFDGDGDLDLFVSSGGYELPVGDVLLSDRLYVNDGVGGFARVGQEVCPGGRSAGGAVAAGDYDRDGDMDLFVGGRLVPGRYPESGTNRLLVNEGGKLVERTPGVLRQTGLVTAAMWSDSDGDGWEDLLVAHEWGAVRVFRNRDKRLVDETGEAGLEGLLGWWYAIAESDVDGDGDRDYVVGNVGLNTKYRATVENPELLYYGDLDGSGKAHLVEAKTSGEKLLPRRGLSCSSGAMPLLGERIKTFHDFASATLAEVYAPERLRVSRQFAVNELRSGVLKNDGRGRFRFEPLPVVAQIAPVRAVVAGDLDGDGDDDVFLGQNFFGPQRETGRMDGGLSLVLEGDGKGGFEVVWPDESGVVIGGEVRALAWEDVDGDGVKDMVVARHGESPAVLLNRSVGRE